MVHINTTKPFMVSLLIFLKARCLGLSGNQDAGKPRLGEALFIYMKSQAVPSILKEQESPQERGGTKKKSNGNPFNFEKK